MDFNLLKCCLCTKRVDSKSDEKTRKHFHWKSSADEKRTLFTILRNKNISPSPTILNPNVLLCSKCSRLLHTVERQERELAESVVGYVATSNWLILVELAILIMSLTLLLHLGKGYYLKCHLLMRKKR